MIDQPADPPKALRPREAVRRMAPYSPPTAGRSGKLRLDFNENTVGAPPRVAEALSRKLTAEGLAVYPEYGECRAALARHFQVAGDQILLTNGTDEAIQIIVNTYVDDGDQVVLLRPSYAMYRFYAEVAGASIQEIDYHSQDLSFPLEELLEGIGPGTKAVLIANPNNPTGTGAGIQDIEKILRKADHAAVLIDEAYFEFSGVTALPLIGAVPNLFVSRTFSKVFGLAAMRLGCIFSQAENIGYLHKAQSPYSVNMLAAMAAVEAVQDPDHVQHYVEEVLAARQELYEGLEKLRIPYFRSQANFVLFRAGERAIEVRDRLRSMGILVRDRSYELPGCVRVTVGTREQVRRFLHALEEVW